VPAMAGLSLVRMNYFGLILCSAFSPFALQLLKASLKAGPVLPHGPAGGGRAHSRPSVTGTNKVSARELKIGYRAVRLLRIYATYIARIIGSRALYLISCVRHLFC